MTAKYSVELWQSHKSKGNDDCLTGSDHETPEEAKAGLQALKDARWTQGKWAYACIEGPEGRVHEETNLDYRRATEDDETRSEFAMQQGMGLGVNAYNEAIGSEVGDDQDDSSSPKMR